LDCGFYPSLQRLFIVVLQVFLDGVYKGVEELFHLDADGFSLLLGHAFGPELVEGVLHGVDQV